MKNMKLNTIVLVAILFSPVAVTFGSIVMEVENNGTKISVNEKEWIKCFGENSINFIKELIKELKKNENTENIS